MIASELWRPAAGMVLEPNALAAATSTGQNALVTAGPGAGKTELLAQRADYLLRTGQCRYPRRILAISFKVDAAKNLRDRVRRRCPPELAARFDSYTFHAFAKRLIDAFRPVLTGEDELDVDYTIGESRVLRRQITFADMAPLAATILETSSIARSALQQTYGFVFLDEFQDCTNTQYSLVKAAFGGTGAELTAVGDVKQRIMAWAGALDGIFARFADEFDARQLILYQNFRAQPRLRRMQNAMVRVMEPPAAVADGELEGDEGYVEIATFADTAAEALGVTDRIEQWINVVGVPASEIAVLVDKQVGLYTENLQVELLRRGISFRDESQVQDLAAEPVAVLIADFLTLVTGEREPEAYARLMDAAIGSLSNDETNQRAYTDLRQVVDQARRDYAAGQHGSIRSLTNRVTDCLGREVLVAMGHQYQQAAWLDEKIEQTISEIEHLQDQLGNDRAALRAFMGLDSVKIMTIHKAKGLEFDNVVVLAVEEEMFWGGEQEERANFFVAISRARKVLCLTVCRQRPTPSSQPYRWRVARTPHREFLDYTSAAT